ncbi:MAG: SpoIIE family protein phosphatase [Bryobacteraceae bacterium]|nr:SpoIIE family protein phosphatase [Bryobacteraceae bacterium]
MPDISILTQDGKTRSHPLEGDRVGLGRATVNELCFPDDNGLSRQHLFFERDGDGWTLSDPGSKNGTMLNGERVDAARRLKPGDRIHAGHLTIVYGVPTRPFNETVVFIDTRDEKSTVSRQLAEVLPQNEKIVDPAKTPVSADKVGALIKAGRELAGHRPLADPFPTILNLAIEAVNAERGVLLAYEGDSLDVKASSGGSFRISSGVRDRVLRDKASILVNDVMSDEAFRGMQSLVQQQVRMLMTVPLQTNDQVIGLIYVDSPTLTKEFTVEDLNLLTVMANVAAIRIEHARLAEVEQAERILTKDLEQAAIIQQGLLPSKAPVVPGLELAGYNAASRSVGGDYYDFLTYPDGKLGLVLGDVSGKAMPAALLMSSLQARLRVLAEDITDVADLMTRLNRHTAANTPSNRFVTLFFLLIDPLTGGFEYTNAGHNPPYLVQKNGELKALEGGGLILGLFPQARYQSFKGALEPGESIVIFSDGVTEATTSANDEYGEERLEETLRLNREKSAGEMVHAITKSVSDFVAGAPAADDLTLVVVRRV